MTIRFYKRRGFDIDGVKIETPHNDIEQAKEYATNKLKKHPGYTKG